MSDNEKSAFSMHKKQGPVSKKSNTLKLKNKQRRKQAKERKKTQNNLIKIGPQKVKSLLESECNLVINKKPNKTKNVKPKNVKPKNEEIINNGEASSLLNISNESIPSLFDSESKFDGKVKPTKLTNGNKDTTEKELERSFLETLARSPSPEDFDNVVTTDSVDEGKKLFSWLIAPFDIDKFFSKVWEKKPIHIARKRPLYYKSMLSTPLIDKMLRNENILYTKNIDITSYANEKRETHNPVGRALPHIVWDYYLNGCSIRLLNPQTYSPRLHLLLATLQEYFRCFVGSNSYLTPPNSQGFAPHYDDIEAFILQMEGKKKWKVYAPISKNDVLPRTSSKNFMQSEIGSPVLEVTLEAGDLLYMPRGFIHQAVTVGDQHSLHVTVSCYQKNSWGDLFEKILPQTLATAIKEDVDFRRGLPLDIFEHLGVVHSDSITDKRTQIQSHIKILFNKLSEYLTTDDAVDQLAKFFMHSALPPIINEQERQNTVYGDSDKINKHGVVKNRVEIQLDTKIRLLRANIIRTLKEEGVIRIYYYAENSKEYQGNEPQFLEIDENLAPGVETLITSYPEYVSVENLEVEDNTDKIQIAGDLWEKGLVMTEEPLEFLE